MNWTTAQLNAAKRGHQTEHDMQVHCVRWFRQKYPRFALLLVAIPNGAKLGGDTPIARAKNWQKLEREGAVKGAADLFLAVPAGSLPGLFIETKTPQGAQSKEQKQFEAAVAMVGYAYALVRSYEEFQSTIKWYMEQ